MIEFASQCLVISDVVRVTSVKYDDKIRFHRVMVCVRLLRTRKLRYVKFDG